MPENQRQQPTEQQLKTLRKIQSQEAGTYPFINSADAEECEDHGWAEAQPGRGYRLTDEGRSLLSIINTS